jgi:feruloyl esterase
MRKAASRVDTGDGGLTPVQGFGFNPGALRMLAYVPEGLAHGAPLVVVLHGCTQRAGGYARAAGWLALADRLGFAVLAPEQTAENNPNRCFNWFESSDTARGQGEAASIHAMVQHMLRSYGLDADRVFVTGLSAGGAMAAAMLAAYPETFAAGAVVAGLPYGLAAGVQEAFAAMRGGGRRSSGELAALVRQAAPPSARKPRLSVWHGDADTTVNSDNGAALARQWAAYHTLAEQPDEVRRRSGRTRSIWFGPDGLPLVELNLLSGLGHGAPVAAAGEDPIGEAGPFVLEAGVSSSLEIARFWGLASPEADSPGAAWTVAGLTADQETSRPAALGDSIIASIGPHVPDEVRQVIANALKSAGLRS